MGVWVKHIYGTGKYPKIKDPPPIKTYPPFPQPIHDPFIISYLRLLLLLSGGRPPYLLGLHIGYFHLGLGLPDIWHHLSNSSDCQQIQPLSSPVTTIDVYVCLGISTEYNKQKYLTLPEQKSLKQTITLFLNISGAFM